MFNSLLRYDIRYMQLYRETNKEKLRDVKEDLKNLKEFRSIGSQRNLQHEHKSILRTAPKSRDA